MTPVEFVELYLLYLDRSEFSRKIKGYFKDDFKKYPASYLFIHYGKFASKQVLVDGDNEPKIWSRALFADRYIPPGHEIPMKFYGHSDEIEELARDKWHTGKEFMTLYLKWLSENDIRGEPRKPSLSQKISLIFNKDQSQQ